MATVTFSPLDVVGTVKGLEMLPLEQQTLEVAAEVVVYIFTAPPEWRQRRGVRVLLLFATPVAKLLQAVQSLPLVGIPTTPLLLLGRLQRNRHGTFCTN
jgi:hypothetical protein